VPACEAAEADDAADWCDGGFIVGRGSAANERKFCFAGNAIGEQALLVCNGDNGGVTTSAAARAAEFCVLQHARAQR
jgi:hypothetical protein